MVMFGSACRTWLNTWLQTVLILMETLTIHLPLVILFTVTYPDFVMSAVNGTIDMVSKP